MDGPFAASPLRRGSEGEGSSLRRVALAGLACATLSAASAARLRAISSK